MTEQTAVPYEYDVEFWREPGAERSAFVPIHHEVGFPGTRFVKFSEDEFRRIFTAAGWVQTESW